MKIELSDVTLAFGRTLALDDVQLEITDGVTGVFGPNGSGKTTLLRVIAQLLRPTRGIVRINDTAASSRDETLRRRLGYAGHDSGLYGRLTVVENLQLFATLYGVSSERVDLVIERLQLHELATRPVSDLSAGSKRRAAVARALLHDPDVLLLDEPYANVDDEAAAAISEAVVSWRRPGKVALVATHGAKKVRAYADHAIVLQQGRVVRVGHYDASGLFAKT